MVSFGVNGFGRIGQGVVRANLHEKKVDIVAVNDLRPADRNVHFLKYDSVHGRLPFDIEAKGDTMHVGHLDLKFVANQDPKLIPWKDLNVDVVMECTGRFTDREGASQHLEAGAKKVLISAPGKNADITVVMGVNHENYNPSEHKIISNASCTTNCLAPIVKVLHEKLGLRRGFMTTIHSYTNDQKILDASHSDLRRARAGALSQIPTSTGAAKAIGLVLPELKGKLDGQSIRVPTPNVSCVDLVVEVDKATSIEEVNALLQEQSEGALKGILGYTTEELVSVDFNGDSRSSIIDALSTNVMGGNLVKVLAWYDNEMGFSYRMVDLAKYIGDRL